MRRGILLLLTLAFVLLGADAGAKLRARRKKLGSQGPRVSFYLADEMAMAATRDGAIAKCNGKRESAAHDPPTPRRSCEESVITVRGPYVRPPTRHEAYEVYVYRGSDGLWYDAAGRTASGD